MKRERDEERERRVPRLYGDGTGQSGETGNVGQTGLKRQRQVARPRRSFVKLDEFLIRRHLPVEVKVRKFTVR